MREILFRGKRLSNNKWMFGSLLCYPDGDKYICSGDFNGRHNHYHVDPETVGQFTGMVDANGMKIFEGDVFQLENDIVGVVTFNCGSFSLTEYGLRDAWTESGYDECGGGYGVIDCMPIDLYFLKDMEVIGNIHDNPELLN